MIDAPEIPEHRCACRCGSEKVNVLNTSDGKFASSGSKTINCGRQNIGSGRTTGDHIVGIKTCAHHKGGLGCGSSLNCVVKCCVNSDGCFTSNAGEINYGTVCTVDILDGYLLSREILIGSFLSLKVRELDVSNSSIRWGRVRSIALTVSALMSSISASVAVVLVFRSDVIVKESEGAEEVASAPVGQEQGGVCQVKGLTKLDI